MKTMKRTAIWFLVAMFGLSTFHSLIAVESQNSQNVNATTVVPGQTNGTMMQYFEWYLPNDGQLWNKLNSEVESLSDNGITALWLPPAYKGSSQEDVGYGVYDMYDLGEFNQKNTVRTKYGTKAELKTAIDNAHANGISVYGDTVMNHRMGADGVEQAPAFEVNGSNRNQITSGSYNIGAWTSFTFPGREVDPGKTTKFEWKWWHFDGVDYNNNNGQSKVFRFDSNGKGWDWEVDSENGNYDYLMGADLDFNHPEVQQEMKDWGEWYRQELNLDGYRLDAVKHIQYQYLQEWTQYQRAKAGKDLFTVGEYWSPDYQKLDNFQNKTGNVMSLFDAPLHYNFRAASTGNGNYDLRSIENNTMMKYNSTKAVTLVDNHDTQTGQALQSEVLDWFKPQSYNYILLHQAGYPSVFYKDYYNPTFGPMIQKLVKARKLYAYGTERVYNGAVANADTADLVGWTREGDSSHLNSGLASLISDSGSGVKSKWMEVGKQHAGEVWYDYTGNLQETVSINADGWGEFKVNGSSQSVWVKQVENKVPTIDGADALTIAEKTAFNPQAGIVAQDPEDGDITAQVTIAGSVNTDVPGVYTLTYTVVDSGGLSVTKSRDITVVAKTVPVINGAISTEIVAGDVFDALVGVSAHDADAKDLTSRVNVEGVVDVNTPGTYTLVYTVTDDYQKTTTVSRQVVVNKKPIVCQDKQIIDGEYRFYVTDCEQKVVTYALQFASYDENRDGKAEAIKGYQYYPNTVYDGVTDDRLDGTVQNHVLYAYEMNRTERNGSKPRHGIVNYAAKYTDGSYMLGKPTVRYEYYTQAEFMKNQNLKIYRILNLDSMGKVRNEIRRTENTTAPYVAFEFFNRFTYEQDKDYAQNNNLKTTFKLSSTSEIVYAYGKQMPLGYAYLYTYHLGTLYDGTQGSQILSTVVQKNAPLDMPTYM